MSETHPSFDECAAEPIAFPGKIQPHGALLIIDQLDRKVRCASDNVDVYLGVQAEALLGQPLWSDCEVPPQLLRMLGGGPERGVGAYEWAALGLRVRVHTVGAQVVVEIERLSPREGTHFHDITPALTRIQEAPDAMAAIVEALREIQALIGYDRIMAYQFDAAQNGQVIAERLAPGIHSFLGLRFPAADIPPQARALYATQWLRMIPDVEYEPVALLAADGEATSFDLSTAVLRSVSPVHVQYLKNMGVGASLSVSVRCDGKLWGSFGMSS